MPAVAHPSGLTWKQRMFARIYVSNGGDPVDAALKAGFSPDNVNQYGNKLLQDPKMTGLVEELFEERMAPLDITFEKKLLHLKDIIIDALSGTYEKVREKQASQAIAIKAIEVLNKMQGHNADASEGTRVTVNTLLESKEVKELSQTAVEIKVYDKEY